MDAEIDEEELAGTMGAGAALVQCWGTLLAIAEEVMGPDKPDAGSCSDWMDDTEDPPKNRDLLCTNVRAARSLS